jgi:FtsH-binding integral membrane protein
MAQVYLLMSVGMVVTAMVATWVTNSLNLQYALISSPMLSFGLFIFQVIIIVALSAAVLGALTLYLDFINLFLLMLRASRR